MILTELHSNSVVIGLPHGCSSVVLLRFSRLPFCGKMSGPLFLNETLLMHRFFCQIANQVIFFYFFFLIVRFTLHLNVKNLQSLGNLN